MPFKSKAQVAKMAELEKEGKVKKGTVKEWMKETHNPKKLPERIGPEKPKSTDALRKNYKERFGIK